MRIALFATAALLIGASTTFAQSSSLFGNRGVTGSSGSLSNGVGANQGQSAFGNSGSMTGFTGASAGTQSGFASGAQVNGGLAGMSNSGNFVGNRALQSGTGGAGGRTGMATQGGLSGRNSLSGNRNISSQQNRGNQNRNAASGAQSVPIRPVQVISFDVAPRTGNSIEASLGSDIASAASQGRLPGLSVTADGQGTVTLSGQVATESDRRKAELMARLEPGVRNVVNRITVSEP